MQDLTKKTTIEKLLAQAQHNQSVSAAFTSPPTKEKKDTKPLEMGPVSSEKEQRSSSSSTTTLPASASNSSTIEVVAEKNEVYTLQLKEVCEHLCLQEPLVVCGQDELKSLLLALLQEHITQINKHLEHLKNKKKHTQEERTKAEAKRQELSEEFALIEIEKIEIDNDAMAYVLKKSTSESQSEFRGIALEQLRQKEFLKEPVTFPQEIKKTLSFLKKYFFSFTDINKKSIAPKLWEDFKTKPLEELIIALGQIQTAMTHMDDKTFRFFSHTFLPPFLHFITSKITPENLEELARRCSSKGVHELAAIQKALSFLSLPAHVCPELTDELENFRTAFNVFATTKIKNYSDLYVLATLEEKYWFEQSAMPTCHSLNSLLKDARDTKAHELTRLMCWANIRVLSKYNDLLLFAEGLNQSATLSFGNGTITPFTDFFFGSKMSIALAIYIAVMIEPYNCRIRYLEEKIAQYESIQTSSGKNDLSENIQHLECEIETLYQKKDSIYKKLGNIHPITQVIVSYATALINTPRIFKLYSNFEEFEKHFVEEIKKNLKSSDQISQNTDSEKIAFLFFIFDDFIKNIIQPELKKMSIPELNLGKEKYSPSSNEKVHTIRNFLDEFKISPRKYKEHIAQEIHSILEKITQEEKKLDHQKKYWEEKKKEINSIKNEIQYIKENISSLDKTEKGTEIKILIEIKLKKQLEESSLEREMKLFSQEIAETEKGIKSSKTLQEYLSNFLTADSKETSDLNRLHIFIVWIQSEIFSKYLQGSFMKCMMDQIWYRPGSNPSLDAFFDQAKKLPDFNEFILRYISNIQFALKELPSTDPRVSILQTAEEGLKQFKRKAEKLLEKANTMGDQIQALGPYYSLDKTLQNTFEAGLVQLAKNVVLPVPVQTASASGPTTSTPTLSRQNSDVQNTVKRGFWARLSRSSQSSNQPPSALSTTGTESRKSSSA